MSVQCKYIQLSAMSSDTPANTPRSCRTVSLLLKLNWVAVVLHILNLAAMVYVTFENETFKSFSVPLTYSGLIYDKEEHELKTESYQLVCMPLWPFCVSFFSLSALFQLIAGCFYYNEMDPTARSNYWRWSEYAISSSCMIFVIAVLVGVRDCNALLCILLLNACMNLFGLLAEQLNRQIPPRTGAHWLPFLFGCLAGIGPWTCIIGTLLATSEDMPKFVYGIFGSYLFMFVLFPINMCVDLCKQTKEAHVTAEISYIILSLTAKSLLGWLVFSGLKQPASSCL